MWLIPAYHYKACYSQELKEIKAKAEQRQSAPARMADQREIRLANRYPDWRQAILPAAEALFNLNRYAKPNSCRRDHKEEIYEVTTDLVRVLYQLRYATEVGHHY